MENAALAGVGVLASIAGGFRRVLHELNKVQVEVARAFLGLPQGHLVPLVGRWVKILAETRLLTRTGTSAAVRVVMARARLACLPPEHPASAAARAACKAGGRATWLDHSRHVMVDILGV